MLLEFKVENFRSFYNEATLSMLRTSKRDHLETLIKIEKYELLPTVVIYGGNANGKTNIVLAQQMLKEIVLRRSITRDNDLSNIINNLPICSFIHDKKRYMKPIIFDITFIYDETKYNYKCKIANKTSPKMMSTVSEEYLAINDTEIFNRVLNDVKLNKTKKALQYYSDTNDISKDIDNLKKRLFALEENLDQNMSEDLVFTSWYSTINKRIVDKIYEWFKRKYEILYDFNETPYEINIENMELKEDEKVVLYHKIFDTFKKNAEFGPQEINLVVEQDKVKQKTEFISKYTMNDEESNNPIAIISANAQLMESKGTLKLLKFMIPFAYAIQEGSTMVIDELDSSLHPEIVTGIIRVFKNPKINTKGAQLIFNTHNPIYLNKNLFRRDEIVFVERDKDSLESEMYRLADIEYDGKSIRLDEQYMKNYVSGKYGALPFIDFEYITEELLDIIAKEGDVVVE